MADILLCVSASVSLYKSCDLASKLVQGGHRLRTVLTANAAKMISPQLFEAITGDTASVSEWGAARRGAMDHIDLGRFAEVCVVAPCSADLTARLAHGQAGDLVTTALLATKDGIPKLVCPAMNPLMLSKPAVQRNIETLRSDGWTVVEPGAGHMACGDDGMGRLAEPLEIIDALERALEQAR